MKMHTDSEALFQATLAKLDKPWYPPKEAAPLANHSLKSLERLMRDGTVAFCRISKRKRVILAWDLARLIVGGRVVPPPVTTITQAK